MSEPARKYKEENNAAFTARLARDGVGRLHIVFPEPTATLDESYLSVVRYNYYLGGKQTSQPDTHQMRTINDLPNQRERALSALYYGLELTNLYKNPANATAEHRNLQVELKKLQANTGLVGTEAIVNEQNITNCRNRIRGLSIVIATMKGVENDIRQAATIYESDYLRDGRIPDLDKIMDLHDKTDDLAEIAPFITAIESMKLIDSDSRNQAARLGRIMLLEEQPQEEQFH